MMQALSLTFKCSAYKRCKELAYGTNGVSMLEFAITLPLLICFIFAIIDLSIVISSKVILSDALYQAAREAARLTNKRDFECREEALRKFKEHAAVFGVFARIKEKLPDFDFHASDAWQDRTVRVTLSAKIPCVFFCRLLLNPSGISLSGSGSETINFSSRYDMILEDQKKCL